MKKMLLIVIILGIIIVGSLEIFLTFQNIDRGNSKDDKKNLNSEFVFKDKDITIKLGEEFSKEKLGLGDELQYSETASCAFDGLDKTYTYPNYEIATFLDGDKDRVYTIYFLTEEAMTTEGIKLSDGIEKMIETYGRDYELSINQYTYTKGNTKLQFIAENDVIVSIEYLYVTKN